MHCSQFRDPPPGREELRIGKERQRIETIPQSEMGRSSRFRVNVCFV